MKPPATVWVVVTGKGEPVVAEITHQEAEKWARDTRGDTIHRYRLDTPKPRKAKKRVKRG